MVLLYDIREAKVSEGSSVQHFLDSHWKKNHSLVLSRDLLDFQHLNKIDYRYNYVIAISNSTHEIDALFGYIPTYQYDESLKKFGDFWGAIWKKREDIENEESNEIGMDVFTRIFEYPNFHSFSAIGISKTALKIYKAFQCKTGYLSHYFILNDHIHDFLIAGNVDNDYYGTETSYKSEWCLKEIDANDLSNINIKPVYRPYKSVEYLINRYVKHPIYRYSFYGIYNQYEIKSILVARFVHAKNSMVIRIVDALGELQGSLYDSFQDLLHLTNAEYIDFMNYGIDESVFYEMGFRKLDLEGDLIIPNYFEPFEQRNVKIDIAWKADYENYVAFKGDSDQDRPNIISNYDK